jgi:hypothetical protein
VGAWWKRIQLAVRERVEIPGNDEVLVGSNGGESVEKLGAAAVEGGLRGRGIDRRHSDLYAVFDDAIGHDDAAGLVARESTVHHPVADNLDTISEGDEGDVAGEHGAWEKSGKKVTDRRIILVTNVLEGDEIEAER